MRMVDKTVLEDEIRIKSIDKDNMYEFLIEMPDNFLEMKNFANSINISKSKKSISNILICGMGGSAISGNIIQDLLFDKLKIPIIINRGYELPAFVNNETLIITISYGYGALPGGTLNLYPLSSCNRAGQPSPHEKKFFLWKTG